MHAFRRRIGALAFMLATTIACGPTRNEPPDDVAQRYASTLCASIETCGCYSPYPDRDSCEAEFEQQMTLLLDEEMSFDEPCFDTVLASAIFDTCEFASAMWFPECSLFEPTKGEGEACRAHYGDVPPFKIDECRGDLRCRAGVCRGVNDELPLASVGDACDPSDPVAACPSPALGLYCDVGGVCREVGEVGASCDGPRSCNLFEISTHCRGFGREGEGTCQPDVALGESCEPGDFSPCAWDADFGATFCSFDGVCVADTAYVCLLPQHTYR